MKYGDFSSLVQLGVGLHAGTALLQIYGEIGVQPLIRTLTRIRKLLEGEVATEESAVDNLDQLDTEFDIFRIQQSHVTEQQLFEVLARPYFESLIDPDARGWLNELLAAAELVTITERIAACRDPTDDKFLELAVNGHADLIVSGDGDRLALNPFRQIPIVTPAAFVQG